MVKSALRAGEGADLISPKSQTSISPEGRSPKISPRHSREFTFLLTFSAEVGILCLEDILPRGFDPTTAISLADGSLSSFILPILYIVATIVSLQNVYHFG